MPVVLTCLRGHQWETDPAAAPPDPTPLPPGGGTNNGTPDQPVPPPPPPTSPPPPPPSTPATYVRGSLKPLYQLLPRTEYGRVKNQNVQFQDADYESTATTTSAASKMDEVAALIQRDTGSTTPVDLLPDPDILEHSIALRAVDERREVDGLVGAGSHLVGAHLLDQRVGEVGLQADDA